jgi:diguanylate cyclase (GGDEF)-like protein
VPLTAGFAIGALGGCVVVAPALVLLLLRARRDRPAARGLLLLVLGAGVLLAGQVVATAVVDRSGGDARVAAGAWAAGFGALAVVLLAAGVLHLPGVVRGRLTRLRLATDASIVAASVFLLAWLLLRVLGGRAPEPAGPSARYLLVAVPGLAMASAVCVAALAVWRATGRRGPVATCAAALAGTAVGMFVLVAADRYGGGLTVLAAAGLVVAALIWLTVAAAQPIEADRLAEAPVTGMPPVVLPAVAAAALAVCYTVAVAPLDRVSVLAGLLLGAGLVARQAVAHHDERRETVRIVGEHERFRALALTDPLTGLANRRRMEEELRRRAGDDPHCVLLALDLDGFKGVNDVRGHDVGDMVLVAVAGRLRAAIRPGDLAARMGGDEFSVLVAAGPEQAEAIARRLLADLVRPYDLPGGTVHISSSIGLAVAAAAGDLPTLQRDADVALRFAKRRGKNRVEHHDVADEQWLRRRTEVERELRGAVDRGEMEVVYQPVVAVPEQRVAGVAALMRWRHPGLGAVPAEEFRQVAEESGVIDRLGLWALHQACHELAGWRSQGHDVWLSVKVTGRELRLLEYTAQVVDVLRAHHVPPTALVVELAEETVAREPAETAARLAALRAIGVRVALDRFGSGYSSLAQLRRLPADMIRIDPSLLGDPALLAEAEAGERALGMIDAVVRLGRALNLAVVADGVVDPLQRRVATVAGCRYAQGDLIGPALPGERIEAVLAGDTAHLFPPRPAQDVGHVDSTHEMRQS